MTSSQPRRNLWGGGGPRPHFYSSQKKFLPTLVVWGRRILEFAQYSPSGFGLPDRVQRASAVTKGAGKTPEGAGQGRHTSGNEEREDLKGGTFSSPGLRSCAWSSHEVLSTVDKALAGEQLLLAREADDHQLRVSTREPERQERRKKPSSCVRSGLRCEIFLRLGPSWRRTERHSKPRSSTSSDCASSVRLGGGGACLLRGTFS